MFIVTIKPLFEVFVRYSNFIIALFNAILIYLIFLQFRDTLKPLITTKIIQRDEEVTDRPNVLESRTLYLATINNSKNIAKSINIKFKFRFDGYSVEYKEKELDHLNPGEGTRTIIKSKEISERYSELFEEKSEEKITKIIPKDTLKIDLTVSISYNPIIGRFLPYKIEDIYFIEWGSLKSYPRFEDHPVFLCWNKRDEYYIYKTGNQ
jgi:hypothetical protein